MKFPNLADRTVPCLALTLALALGCLPDPSSAGTGGDSDTTTAGATGTDTDGAPTTSETTEDSTVEGPLPCDGDEGLLLGAGVIAEPSMEEPSDISLTLGSDPLTCENPDQQSLTREGDWFVRIGIPAAIQAPGLYALEELSTLALSGKKTCDGAVGGQLRGTLEIFSIDEAEVRGQLCHLEGQWVDDNPTNGTGFSFVASRCP
ncbi:hypothetical protein [Nannocystis punicea]|uniref:Lipoprotein n=1 Tax=Nannocystis punicea TaxID=2995304 RepID=A0ABY7H8X2_9BACT|nr:hypothetical protein [Nannocystis poenicansa]WAS95713.1 hypothetical protein O0S08_06085 [Nannocystis poenicansa]